MKSIFGFMLVYVLSISQNLYSQDVPTPQITEGKKLEFINQANNIDYVGSCKNVYLMVDGKFYPEYYPCIVVRHSATITFAYYLTKVEQALGVIFIVMLNENFGSTIVYNGIEDAKQRSSEGSPPISPETEDNKKEKI